MNGLGGPIMPRNRFILLMVFAAFFLFRLWYASVRQLIPDEAFYWVLSRHLAGGYLDHPPMVALLIKLATAIGGGTEIAVRLPDIFMAFGTVGVLVAMAARILPSRPEASVALPSYLWLALFWLVSPLFSALAGLATPDTPAIFFSVCALACAIIIARRIGGGEGFLSASPRTCREGRGAGYDLRTTSHVPRCLHPTPDTRPPTPDPRLPNPTSRSTLLPWLCFGLFCGLALVSKYTTILLPFSVVMALLFSQTGRRELRRPGIYLAALLALAVFGPVIDWNATHQWVSFRYQLHHGLSGDQNAASVDAIRILLEHLRTLGEFVGAQFLMFTPVFFVVGLVVLVVFWAGYRRLDLSRRILLWSASVPLAVFALASARTHGEANWPAFAYFPLSILMIEWARPGRPEARRVKWIQIGCMVAVPITFFVNVPEAPWELGLVSSLKHPMPRKLVEMSGWREMGRFLDKESRGALVVCATHEDAGEAAFYMTGQPEVWCASVGPDSRPTSFDYFAKPLNFAATEEVLLVNMGRNARLFAQRQGLTIDGQVVRSFAKNLYGHWRDRSMVMAVRPPLPSTMPSLPP